MPPVPGEAIRRRNSFAIVKVSRRLPLRSLLGSPRGPCLLHDERGQGYVAGEGAHRL